MTIFGRGNVAPSDERDNNFLFRRFSVLYIRDLLLFFFPLLRIFFSLAREDSRDAMRNTKTYRYVSRIRAPYASKGATFFTPFLVHGT